MELANIVFNQIKLGFVELRQVTLHELPIRYNKRRINEGLIDHLGICKFDINTEVIHVNQQIIPIIPRSISIQVKDVPDDFIILTLAHESAHLLTPIIKCGYITDDHSTLFYQNYAKILRYLEEQSIFILKTVSKRSKFSTANLKYLDKIDPINSQIKIGIYKFTSGGRT